MLGGIGAFIAGEISGAVRRNVTVAVLMGLGVLLMLCAGGYVVAAVHTALALRYGVGRLSVFGSMARNDANAASDVDLLLENSEGLTGFQLGALQMDAQDLLGRKVDLLTLQALHPLLREKILSEAVVL
jgi:predicted nucleotidyltransferase